MALTPMEYDDVNTFTGTLDVKTGVTNLNFNAKKTGHVICVYGILQKNVTSGENALCVFPSGYRPATSIRVLASNSTDDAPITARIDADGTFVVYPKVAKIINIAFTLVYFDY